MALTPGQPFSNLQPYLAVTFVTPGGGTGIFPGNRAVGNMIGFLYGFAGNYAPGSTYAAKDQLIEIANDDTTFQLIGTTYGGDGQDNYAIPDLQGRAILGEGSGPGLSSYLLGGVRGTATVSLTLTEIPPGATPTGGGGQPFLTIQPSLPLKRLICVSGVFPSNFGTGDGSATFIGQVATFAGNFVPGGWMEAAGQTLTIQSNTALFAILGTTYGGNGTSNFKLPDLRSRVSVGADNNQPLGSIFGQEAVTLALGDLPPPTGSDQPVNNVQPSLALNYIICTSGIFPLPSSGQSLDSDIATLGQIAEFAGNYAPVGWALCDGAVLSLGDNPALFSILGNTYGGDGISSFALPDLRGRTLVGAGTGFGSTFQVGDAGGNAATTLGLVNVPPCFVAGTRILTARGEVAVQALTEADHAFVLTGAGLRRVRWIGHRRIALAGHPRPWDVHPVRVAAGAFAPGTPHDDLWLSPDHAVFFPATGGVATMLVPIRYLINGATIVQEAVGTVTYYHVELAAPDGAAAHDVLLAQGLPAESYLDTGNRGAFDNADGPVMLHADFAPGQIRATPCARMILDGPDLTRIRAALLARAQQLGHARTNDPGLYLLADGVIIRPERNGDTYRFALPRGASALRLWSRRGVPAHVRADSSDTRAVGVAVRAIALDGRRVALDSPALSDGWYGPEAEWRWTTGNAGLDPAGARVLDLALAPMVAYWETVTARAA